MKKILLVLLLLLGVSCSVNKDNTYDAVVKLGYGKGVDNSSEYDWDPIIDWVQMFQLDADSTIHLKNEQGIVAVDFIPSLNDDGTLICKIESFYVVRYRNIAFGWVTKPEDLNEYLGGDLEFTLFINEENVVTSNDWPTLIPE